MFSVDAPLPVPRRNLEDADEDLLEGLGAESMVQPQEALDPPSLSWKQSLGNTNTGRVWEALVIASKKASTLLRLFGKLDDESMMGTIKVPGVTVKDKAKQRTGPNDDTACNIYKTKSNAVLVGCNVDVPVESLHAWASLILKQIQARQVIVLDVNGMTDVWPKGSGNGRVRHYLDSDEEKPLDLRSICTTALMESSKDTQNQSLYNLAPRLEVGCPVTGIPAAIIARCQMMKIPAVCFLGQLNPASAAEFQTALKPFAAVVNDISGGVMRQEEGGQEGLDEAVKSLANESHLRMQATSSLYI